MTINIEIYYWRKSLNIFNKAIVALAFLKDFSTSNTENYKQQSIIGINRIVSYDRLVVFELCVWKMVLQIGFI